MQVKKISQLVALNNKQGIAVSFLIKLNLKRRKTQAFISSK